MLAFILVGISVFFAYRYIRDARRLPTPPGPKGLPVLGNALQMPREHSWLAFTEWANVYGQSSFALRRGSLLDTDISGPIMHLSVLGSSFIVLSSREVVVDLLEKRSTMYSDRPVIPMAGELWVVTCYLGFPSHTEFNYRAGMDRFVALLPYGHRLREGRKLILGTVNTRRASELHAVQEAKTADFISRLAREPSEFRAHIRWCVFSLTLRISCSVYCYGRLVAAIVMQVTYGLAADRSDDPFIISIAKALKDFSDVAAPGAYLVDVLPICTLLRTPSGSCY